MAIKDLVPKFRHGRSAAVQRKEWDPFRELQREMNRMFDDFFVDLPVFGGQKDRALGSLAFSPAVDIAETDKELKVSVELPGIDEKDISVELDNATLIIRGEKSEEWEDKSKKWHVREQSYGSFQRLIPLPVNADSEQAKAKFEKGVLTISIPKLDDNQHQRKTVKIENG
jgi:HSP20 family protein